MWNGCTAVAKTALAIAWLLSEAKPNLKNLI